MLIKSRLGERGTGSNSLIRIWFRRCPSPSQTRRHPKWPTRRTSPRGVWKRGGIFSLASYSGPPCTDSPCSALAPMAQDARRWRNDRDTTSRTEKTNMPFFHDLVCGTHHRAQVKLRVTKTQLPLLASFCWPTLKFGWPGLVGATHCLVFWERSQMESMWTRTYGHLRAFMFVFLSLLFIYLF